MFLKNLYLTGKTCKSSHNPYKYKYNGKELQDELELRFYDYGARSYDRALGRWMILTQWQKKAEDLVHIPMLLTILFTF